VNSPSRVGWVAVEFERQVMYEDAAFAWQLARLFARDIGDREFEKRAQKRFKAVARALYINSAL
jgi:hypothetical protein